MNAWLGIDRVAIDALARTLIYFVWQAAAIGVAFAVVDRALARARANTRYLAACGTLILLLVVPMSQFAAFRLAAPRPSLAAVSLAPAPVTHRAPVSDLRVAPSSPRVVRDLPRPRAGTRLSFLFPWVVAAWSLGVLLLTARLLGGWWIIQRLRRSGRNAAIPEWQPRLRAIARRLGVSRPVRLLRSAIVQVPTAMGWLRPVILLPASTLSGLSPKQIESILAHELAHIRRHDYVVNLLQSLVETLLFYHPVVWWVSRRIREERELCCDDLAVVVAGDPLLYADALARLEVLRGEATLALAANGGSLLTRIARLIGTPPRGDDHGSRGLGAVLGATLVVTLTALPNVQSVNHDRGAAAAEVHATTAVWRRVATSVRATRAAVKALATASPIASNAADVSDDAPAAPAPATDPGQPAPPAEPVAPAAPAPVIGSRSYYTVDEWIELSRHGVRPETVERYRAAGLTRLPAADLITLADNGVGPEYVSKLGREDFAVKDLVRLAQHGVTPEFVNTLRELGSGDLLSNDLVTLADHGVTAEWYAAMRWMGYSSLTVEKAIRLHDSGISPDFAGQLKVASRKRFNLDELVEMQNHGVTAEYAGQIESALGAVESGELIRLHDMGVSTEYVNKMRIVGGYGVEDLIVLSQQGVSPEYVFEMGTVGYRHLDARDLVRLRQSDVTAEFVTEVREKGYPQTSVSEIIQMRQHGLGD
jgi:beta-lactamase regulating signal transducer with metallopeptidase domain